MACYHVDDLAPEHLVCGICGQAVATGPEGLRRTKGVTWRRVFHRFEDLADVLARHDRQCPWRPRGARFALACEACGKLLGADRYWRDPASGRLRRHRAWHPRCYERLRARAAA
jgi:hypothetical protein